MNCWHLTHSKLLRNIILKILSVSRRLRGNRRGPNIALSISLEMMPSRHDPKEKTNRHKRTEQGKCSPVPEQQQQPETDFPSDAPPTRPGIAVHPNRHWTVIELDLSHIPRPGRGHDHIIRPWQLDAVVGAPADRVDEVIDLVRDLEEPPRPGEGDFQAFPAQSALGSGHRREIVNQNTMPSDTGAASDQSGSKGSHGKSASTRQGLFDCESGISLDGFPSRSMEEGGVGGLCRRNSDGASDGAASAATTCSSAPSSRASIESSAMTVDGATIRTARAVTIHPRRAAYPYDGVIAVNRLPLPAELDRMDERLEDALGFLTDFSPGAGNADGHPAGVEYAQSRPASPTASESSIAETVFDVRRPTPPPPSPPQSDVVSLPSSRRRDGTHPSSGVGQEEAVPAALVPRGWLGLGGSHPPPQVSRRRARGDPEGEEEDRRWRKAREEWK